MENNLMSYTSQEFGTIRTLDREGEPWFVGKDVAVALGYSNTNKAIADHVDDDDKMDGVTFRDPMGREQKPIIINESGLYSLVIDSKLPTAKKFKRWVTSEVLPSIRKTGGYMSTEAAFKRMQTPEGVMHLMVSYLKERDKAAELELKCEILADTNDALNAEAQYARAVLRRNNCRTVTEIAADYNMKAAELNEFLCAQGVQRKRGTCWEVCSPWDLNGYTEDRTIVIKTKKNKVCKNYLVWNERGQKFINQLLRETRQISL